jgi:hypothetical protein
VSVSVSDWLQLNLKEIPKMEIWKDPAIEFDEKLFI